MSTYHGDVWMAIDIWRTESKFKQSCLSLPYWLWSFPALSGISRHTGQSKLIIHVWVQQMNAHPTSSSHAWNHPITDGVHGALYLLLVQLLPSVISLPLPSATHSFAFLSLQDSLCTLNQPRSPASHTEQILWVSIEAVSCLPVSIAHCRHETSLASKYKSNPH